MMKFFTDLPSGDLQLPKQYNDALNIFLAQVPQLLGINPAQTEEIKRIQEELEKVITPAVENLRIQTKLKEMREKLIAKRFDKDLLENPKLTEEIKILIHYDVRSFVQYLFTHCHAKEVLNYWLTEQSIELPKDALALAIALRSHKVVFEYLFEQEKYLNLSITSREKQKLLSRAQRNLGQDAFDYLNEKLVSSAADIKPIIS